MPKEKGEPETDENYFCHIIIPSKDYRRSKVFFEKVFGWRVEALPGIKTMDVLPPSGKGPSAELNSEEEVVIPSIYTSNIDRKLELIEEHGGKVLRGRAPIWVLRVVRGPLWKSDDAVSRKSELTRFHWIGIKKGVITN